MTAKHLLAAAAATVLFAGAAPAATVNFTFFAGSLTATASGAGNFVTTGDVGTFTLASGLTSFDASGTGSFFNQNGPFAIDESNLSSFSTTLGGGLVTSLSLGLTFSIAGGAVPVLINVSPTATSATTGIYALNGSVAGSAITGTFVTAPVIPGAVPEPATWVMMIGGFGLTGAALRRRKVTVRYA